MEITIKEIINALEGRANNTDTDPRWLAATELRKLSDWASSFCTIDVELEKIEHLEFSKDPNPPPYPDEAIDSYTKTQPMHQSHKE